MCLLSFQLQYGGRHVWLVQVYGEARGGVMDPQINSLLSKTQGKQGVWLAASD